MIDSTADGVYGVFSIDIDGDSDTDLLAANRDANTIVVYSQIRTHVAALAIGGTLLIDAALLWSFDADDGPGESTYTITQEPSSGELWCDGLVLTTSGQFTQYDINSSRIQYMNFGQNTIDDRFDFIIADGGENDSNPAAGTFSIDIIDSADLLVYLPLDEGNGLIANDTSGMENDALLRNGAVFDSDTPIMSGFNPLTRIEINHNKNGLRGFCNV